MPSPSQDTLRGGGHPARERSQTLGTRLISKVGEFTGNFADFMVAAVDLSIYLRMCTASISLKFVLKADHTTCSSLPVDSLMLYTSRWASFLELIVLRMKESPVGERLPT